MSEDRCKWCGVNDAVTTLLGWRTCKSCVEGGPRFRVARWCRQAARDGRAVKRMERDDG